MVSPATEHLSEREERLIHLVAEIDAAILDGETTRDHNTLGLTLLLRALDIFHANYEDEDVLDILSFMYKDRKQKRQFPTTQEYVERSVRAAKWLPGG